MNEELIGTVYVDPEGIWKITAVIGNLVKVKNIKEGSLGYGREYITPLQEALYYIENAHI